MQFRWIAIGAVCFSAALMSACGGAPSTALASKADASAMSKTDARYDTSSKDKDKDECDESEDHDKSNDKSHSLTMKAKDDDAKECKDSDEDHDKSKNKYSSHSLSMASKSSDKDKDHDDDDANCKVTVCHIPPGNACKEHQIRVGKSAVRAHIEHGDYLGSCDAPPPPPPPPACGDVNQPCCTGAQCLAGLACGGVDGNTCDAGG